MAATTSSLNRSTSRWHRLAATLGLIVLIGILLALVLGMGRDPRALPSPLIGKPAPHFNLPLLSGGTFDSREGSRKVLVVNFWASWCYPACYEEAPELQRFWERYRERGVVVVGINVQDREASAREFLRRFDQTFPNVVDRTGRVSIDFGLYGVPETFIVDRTGRIVYKHVGAVTERLLVERVEPLLSDGAGSRP